MITGNNILVFGGGFQSDYVREITNALASKFDTIYLIYSGDQRNQYYKSNIKLFDFRGNTSSNRNIFIKAFDLIRFYYLIINFIIKNKIKILFDPSIGRFWVIVLFYSILNVFNTKIILVVHNVLPHGKNDFINKFCYKYIYTKLTDHLIVHTKYLRSKLISDFKVNEKKITIANHGIYKVIDDLNTTKNLARQKLGYKEDDFILLIFGQQYPYKGTLVFIKEHFKLIAGKAHLIIKGTGSQSYENEIKETVKELNLELVITYEFKFVPDDERELLFKACDCVIIPYLIRQPEWSTLSCLFLWTPNFS